MIATAARAARPSPLAAALSVGAAGIVDDDYRQAHGIAGDCLHRDTAH